MIRVLLITSVSGMSFCTFGTRENFKLLFFFIVFF